MHTWSVLTIFHRYCWLSHNILRKVILERAPSRAGNKKLFTRPNTRAALCILQWKKSIPEKWKRNAQMDRSKVFLRFVRVSEMRWKLRSRWALGVCVLYCLCCGYRLGWRHVEMFLCISIPRPFYTPSDVRLFSIRWERTRCALSVVPEMILLLPSPLFYVSVQIRGG